MTKLIHATDQYKIFEEEISLEDSTDVSRVLTIEYEDTKRIILNFSFGKMTSKSIRNEKWCHKGQTLKKKDE